jgi:CheY-like chemotaxis protein
MTGQTILIVEDTELIRRMYHDKLVEEGYQVLVASDGQEGLNVLRSSHVDLVVLDLIMPVMSGLEALEVMKSDPRTKDIPVIILSNLGQESDIERGVELGATDYLIKNSAKPADVAEKIQLILGAMGGRMHEKPPIRLLIRDREGGAEELVTERDLKRRFWCPACEEELVLELLPKDDRPGWFDAHLLCAQCGKEY